jgi:hypothetical protein
LRFIISAPYAASVHLLQAILWDMIILSPKCYERLRSV